MSSMNAGSICPADMWRGRAAQGFVVLALEHADGTAAACRLAGGLGWRYYSGWGSEAERARQTQCAPHALRTGLCHARS